MAEKTLLSERIHEVAHAVDALSKPYLAAIAGVAVGAGMDMALMADIRFAAQSARMSERYVRVGLVPGDGGCYYLPRIVGTAAALRLLWTGEFVDAAEALQLGLVSAVHSDEELLERTWASPVNSLDSRPWPCSSSNVPSGSANARTSGQRWN